jgi:hypothetical protein
MRLTLTSSVDFISRLILIWFDQATSTVSTLAGSYSRQKWCSQDAMHRWSLNVNTALTCVWQHTMLRIRLTEYSKSSLRDRRVWFMNGQVYDVFWRDDFKARRERSLCSISRYIRPSIRVTVYLTDRNDNKQLNLKDGSGHIIEERAVNPS